MAHKTIHNIDAANMTARREDSKDAIAFLNAIISELRAKAFDIEKLNHTGASWTTNTTRVSLTLLSGLQINGTLASNGNFVARFVNLNGEKAENLGTNFMNAVFVIREWEARAQIAGDNEVYRCNGCGREEGVCSVNPCADVIADRDEGGDVPPDPEHMNDQRARAAGGALQHFTRTFGEMAGGDAQNLSDLLADLAHYCDRNKLSFTSCLDTARMHYDEETDNQGTQFDDDAPQRADESTKTIQSKQPEKQIQDALCSASVLAHCAVLNDVRNRNEDSAGLSAKWSMQIARALCLSFGNPFPMTEDETPEEASTRQGIEHISGMPAFACPRCGKEYDDRTTEDEVKALRAKRSHEETGACCDDCEGEDAHLTRYQREGGLNLKGE